MDFHDKGEQLSEYGVERGADEPSDTAARLPDEDVLLKRVLERWLEKVLDELLGTEEEHISACWADPSMRELCWAHVTRSDGRGSPGDNDPQGKEPPGRPVDYWEWREAMERADVLELGFRRGYAEIRAEARTTFLAVLKASTIEELVDRVKTTMLRDGMSLEQVIDVFELTEEERASVLGDQSDLGA